MVRVNILALRCPECAAILDGLEHDQVFFCASCKRGYEPKQNGGEGFHALQYGAVKPRKSTKDMDMIIWLPMWGFHVSATVETADEKLRKKAQRVIDEFPRVWVGGFRMWRASYFGDPGYLYTSKALGWEDNEQPELPELAGLCRKQKTAARFIKPYLLSALDRRIDVAFIDIRGDIIDARLLAVPFGLRGDEIIDTQIDWEYPETFVEDLRLLKKIRRDI